MIYGVRLGIQGQEGVLAEAEAEASVGVAVRWGSVRRPCAFVIMAGRAGTRNQICQELRAPCSQECGGQRPLRGEQGRGREPVCRAVGRTQGLAPTLSPHDFR